MQGEPSKYVAPSASAPSAPGAAPGAASAAPTPAVDDRGSAFRAIDGSGESVKGGSLLVAAYAFVWVVVLVLVVRTFFRQSHTEAELGRLQKALEKAPKP
jgi:CcmD family protein